METLRPDSVPDSPGACRLAEHSTTAVDGVGGGERLAMTASDLIETPGATARAAESLRAEVGATDVMSESRVDRPAASEEEAACPEMP